MCIIDADGKRIAERVVNNTIENLSELGKWLYECRAEGIALWAAIEKPEGRMIDFLLDHEVLVYPINSKALDRARDRFRVSRSKSDPFDAWVLANLLRTDHAHLHPLTPNSSAAAELKMMTRDYQKLVRQQTRWINQLKATLKEYYPRSLEAFEEMASRTVLDFLQMYPTPNELKRLSNKQWQEFTRTHRLNAERTNRLWALLHSPQIPMPHHVVRARSKMVLLLVTQLQTQAAAHFVRPARRP